jgi:hypothetical protein
MCLIKYPVIKYVLRKISKFFKKIQLSDQLRVPALLKPRKEPLCTLNGMLGGPHTPSGRFRDEKNLLPFQESTQNFSFLQSSA